MKCSITKQIVTDNKVIIHVVLYRPHIPVTLNGCHLFDFQLFLLWSRITTKSPGLTSCRNLSATFSFYLHRNIWQQTRHFFAVIQHVIFTHIRWWQPLFTPFHAHEWWPAKQNFKWAQVCFYSFSHSHLHQYNWESFKPSQTRLFTAFRQFVLNCLVLPLYCPPWRGRVAAVCSHVNSQELTHLLYCIIDKVSAIIRTDFFWEFPILTTCQPSPDSVSVSHKGLIRWNPSLDIQMDLLVLVEMPRVFLSL